MRSIQNSQLLGGTHWAMASDASGCTSSDGISQAKGIVQYAHSRILPHMLLPECTRVIKLLLHLFCKNSALHFLFAVPRSRSLHGPCLYIVRFALHCPRPLVLSVRYSIICSIFSVLLQSFPPLELRAQNEVCPLADLLSCSSARDLFSPTTSWPKSQGRTIQGQ